MLLRNPEYNYDKRENNFFIFQLAKTFVASYSLKYSAICFHIQKCLAYPPPPPHPNHVHASYGPALTNVKINPYT
jgi:hypothetical protein